MTILTNSYLKNQFKECSGYYNEKFEKYIFSGKKIALECIYNAEEELFMVHKIILSFSRANFLFLLLRVL